MPFRLLCMGTAVICGMLALCLLLLPGLIHWLFGLDMVAVSVLMARRAGFLFVGLCAFYWAVRDVSDKAVCIAVAKGSIVMLIGLACLGMWELVYGIAGPGILLAIGTEVILAALFGLIWREERQVKREGRTELSQGRAV